MATFSPWSWNINIISSAKDKDKFIGTIIISVADELCVIVVNFRLFEWR